MITLSKIKDSFKDGAFRVFKVQQFGAKTVNESAPYGIDSNPRKDLDLDAVFAETSAGGENVILGFIQENRYAQEGEIRLFSENSDKETSTYIWLRNNGIINLGGLTDNLVKYKALNISSEKLELDINAELVKIQAAISTLGGSYVRNQISIDISSSKAENLTTKQ